MFFTCLLVDDYLGYDIVHYLHTWPASPPKFDITKWTEIMKAMIKIHHLRSEHTTYTHRCQCLSKCITCLWASSTISSVSCNMESKPTLIFQAENLFPSYFIHHIQLNNHCLNGDSEEASVNRSSSHCTSNISLKQYICSPLKSQTQYHHNNLSTNKYMWLEKRPKLPSKITDWFQWNVKRK